MRDRPFRFVLIVAALTTLATSAPEDFFIDGDASRPIAALEVAHVRVVFSAGVTANADTMQIDFDWTGEQFVTIVPDDPTQPAIVGGESTQLLVRDLCRVPGPCELGFSIEAAEAPEDTEDRGGNLLVHGIASRAGDSSLCFPDNRDFAEGSTIQVIFD